MKNKILNILRNNITESKNDYNKIYEKDFDNLANELLEAINYTQCCKSDSELLKIPKTTKEQRVQLNEGYNKK